MLKLKELLSYFFREKISNFIGYKFYLIFNSNVNMHFWNRIVVTFLKHKGKEEIAAEKASAGTRSLLLLLQHLYK